MKIASAEIRLIVVRAAQMGIPRAQIADLVGYHINSIGQWIRDYHRENRLEARPRGHRESVFSPEERKELSDLLANSVDMTLEEIRIHFKKDCSLAAISKIIASLGFTFKKNSAGKRTRSRRHPESPG